MTPEDRNLIQRIKILRDITKGGGESEVGLSARARLANLAPQMANLVERLVHEVEESENPT